MKSNKKISSLSNMSLKRRLFVAFIFSTFFPVTILFQYSVNSYKMSLLALFAVVLVIFVGWWFIFEVFSSIIRIHNRTQDALQHIEERGQPQNIGVKNEVERLDVVFNMLSSKVKESVEELKAVNSKTEELNRAIDQKVKILSSILDANVLFSKSAPATEILQFLTERLKEIIQAKIVISFFGIKEGDGRLQFYYGISERVAASLLSEENIKELMEVKSIVVVDNKHKERDPSFIAGATGIKNFIINPVYLREEIVGFIIAGNSMDGFSFPYDIGDIFNLFSYNMSIIWERQRLYKRVEDLEINDPLTGLYNEGFFINRLDEEIKRSTIYQRPCGLIAVKVANYNDYKENIGFIELERILKKCVQIFKENLRPIDILGRVKEDTFGVIVIERNRRQSNYVAARLKDALYSFMEGSLSFAPAIEVAVAESPIDGASAAKLLECIQQQFKTNEI